MVVSMVLGVFGIYDRFMNEHRVSYRGGGHLKISDSLLRSFFYLSLLSIIPPPPLKAPEALMGASLRSLETPMGHL